jgi:hypothetical protein
VNSFIGWNIHAQGVKDKATLRQRVAQMRPRWLVVMDDAGLARLLKADSPTTNVIVRDWQPDGHWAIHRSPEAFIADVRSRYSADDIGKLWFYVDNEVGLNADYNIRLVELNAQHSQPLNLVIVNASVGSIEPREWEADNGRKLLALADQHRKHIVIGLHDAYFMGNPVILWNDTVTDLPIAQWPRKRDSGKGNWLVGRHEWAVRAIRGSHPPPRFVMTEAGPESITAVEKYIGGKLEGGWRRQVDYWRDKWNLGAEEAVYHAFYYMTQVQYRDTPVEGVCWYCYGHNGDQRWYWYDCEELGNTHLSIHAWERPRRLADIPNDKWWAGEVKPPVQPPKPVDPPAKEPFQERVVIVDFSAYSGGVRFRESAVTGREIALLRGKVQALLMADDEKNLDWYKAQIDGRIGWFKQLPGVTFTTPAPPQPEPELGTYEIVYTVRGVTPDFAKVLTTTFGNATVRKVA